MDTHELPVITTADLRATHNPPLGFTEWDVEEARIAVGAVLIAGIATTPADALQYLADFARYLDSQPKTITVADLNGRNASRTFSALRSIVTGVPQATQDAALLVGTISHQAMYALLTGALPIPPSQAEKPPSIATLDLFQGSDREHWFAENGQGLFWQLPERERQRKRRRREPLIRRVASAWEECSGTDYARDWFTLTETRETFRILDARLAVLFGPFAKHIKRQRHGLGPLRSMALMSLGASTYETWTEPRILFHEIPVLSARHRFSGGRIDALEVSAINGKPPTRRQKRILQQLSQSRYGSTGELIAFLIKLFGCELTVRVIDWKFLVGDVLLTRNGMMTATIGDPLTDHQDQMHRYLTLIPVSVALERTGRVDLACNGVGVVGDLTYVLPSETPRHFETVLTDDERERIFGDTLVMGLSAASRRARLREIGNAIHAHLLTILQGKARHAERRNGVNRMHPTLFAFEEAGATLREHLSHARAQRREFLDAHGILEVVRRFSNGTQQLELCYDTLLAAIEKGDVRCGTGFSAERGGKIECLSPEHAGERTPSMQIYLSGTPRFYCFGCEVRGRIASDSIPSDLTLATTLSPVTTTGRRLAKHAYAVDLAEHSRVMGLFQSFLAAAFPKSPAASYLTNERCIDPGLAATYGAGFGNDGVVAALLEAGLTFDEQLFYGILRLSERIPEEHRMVQLLLRHGLTLAELQRPVRKEKGVTVAGLPYFALAGRATFPLMLGGKPNNVYGRHLDPNCEPFLRHRKLATDHTKVPQGGFNMTVLTEPTVEEVIIAEGALDALSLIALGYPNTVALIGVANRAIVAEFALHSHRYGIALDADVIGREKTVKLTAALLEAGFTGTMHDFLSSFCERNDFGGAKDWNAYWVNRQRLCPF